MPDDDAGVELKGLAEANRDMVRWARELGPAVAGGLQSFARTIAGQVQGEVPVLTGTLAASVEVVDAGEGDELGLGIGIGDGVPYAGWIEFGGSRGRALIPEGRYLYPAAADAEPDFTQIASDIAEDTARSFPWSTPAL